MKHSGMKKYPFKNRRSFIRKLSIGGLMFTGLTPKGKAKTKIIQPKVRESENFSANDTIRLGLIGCGIQGFANGKTAEKIQGVEVVAVCDLYQGRLKRAKEVFGDHIYTTNQYKDLINRKDIDAVCVSTSDHWHDKICIEALANGKPVYCEKPMVHKLDEGHAVIEAQNKYGLPFQVGSQRVSSISNLKAKELYENGAIGNLILADIKYDRATSNGAWQYSIPTDANEETVDWDGFLGDAPKRDFDATRFFRWRNYQDYGTAVAGDLFVHLFSGLHLITSSHGPERIFATGGLRFWKDGRDVPDIILGLYDYPESKTHGAFNVQMRSNFVDGAGGGSHVRLIGDEGVMTLGWGSITIERKPISRRPSYGGWDSYDTFDAVERKRYEKWFHKMFPPEKASMISPGTQEYKVPQGYSDHIDHWQVFADAIRKGTPIVEDAVFGMRAAGPALACNKSYAEQRIVNWDPELMKET